MTERERFEDADSSREYYIKHILKRTNGDMDWNDLAQVRDKWRAVTSTSVSIEGNFSASRRNVRFSATSLHAVGWMVV